MEITHSRLTEQAPAKLNLALHITARRPDGYHELDSIVAFAEAGDVLDIQRADQLSLAIKGAFAPKLQTADDNIVFAAWRALQDHAQKTQQNFGSVSFNLTKNLPVAAGIGGGSADAAAALRGLVKLFGLHISEAQLQHIALQLGADVPVCLHPGRYRMRGIGEQLQPLNLQLPPAVLLVNPAVPVMTQHVFAHLALAKGQPYKAGLEDVSDPALWRNDMTEAAITFAPMIGDVLQRLAQDRRVFLPRMSGSGATCLGFCTSLAAAQQAAADLSQTHPDWWVMPSRLL